MTDHTSSEPREPDYCPRCGVAYEPMQEYCLECGARLPTNRGAVGVLAGAWQRRIAWYPGDWVWPVLLFLALTVAATAAAVAAGSRRADSSSTLVGTRTKVAVGPGVSPGTVPVTTAPTPPSVPSATITTGPLPTAPGSGKATGGAPTTPAPSPNALAVWPAGKSGYTDVLESLPLAGGRAAAVARARAAKSRGLPAVGVLVSSQYPSLHAGYYVVFSGIYSSQAAAAAALSDAHAHGFPDAYQSRVTR